MEYNRLGARRSGRQRKLNPHYSNDAFEGLDLDAGPEPASTVNEDHKDEDFNTSLQTVEPNQDDDSSQDARDDENGEIGEPEEGRGVISSIALENTFHSLAKKAIRTNSQADKNSKSGVTTRSLDETYSRSARPVLLDVRKLALEDSEEAIQSAKKWFADVTIPSRRADASGKGGMAYSFYQTDAQRRLEATRAWDWYHTGGGAEAFRRNQKLDHIDHTRAAAYLRRNDKATTSLLMGPSPQRHLHQIGNGQVMDLNLPWRHPSEGTAQPSIKPTSERNGWVVNAGESVHCLDWVPNMHGETQYLAISTMSKPQPSASCTIRAPLFTPAEASPSALQIWDFSAAETVGVAAATIDTTKPPSLRAVICGDWGEVRQFQWCRYHHHHTTPPLLKPDEINLGLLAIVTTDGALRILDITVPNTEATTYLKVTSSLLTSRPPHAVFTCLTWASPFILAAGTSNGHFATFDLRQHLSPSYLSQPQTYTPLHSSTIIALTTCAPSLPEHIISVSLSGLTALTSLSSPASHTLATSALAARTRLAGPSPALAWHEPLRHALFAAEDALTLRAASARRFWAGHEIARSEAQLTVLATSPCHASVLIGAADGACAALNPVRRLTGYRKGVGTWRQRWFKHEWRPSGGGNGAAQSSAAGGASRILTGFAAENLQQQGRGGAPAPRATRKNDAEAGATPILPTIHEHATAVRAACWNPNVEVGGWAAAGLGAGWVIIEDLAFGD